MSARKVICAAIAAVVTATPALAQSKIYSASINFQYREAIPANSDEGKARADILADAERDCGRAEKAFGLKCSINNIQFNNNNFNNFNNFNRPFGNQDQGSFLMGNVNAQLTPDVPGQ